MSLSVLFYFIVAVILTEYLTGFIKNATILTSIRVYFKEKSEFLSELLSCGYCLSVWVSFFVTLTLPPFTTDLPSVGKYYLVDFFCSWIMTTSLSNAWHGFRDRYLETYKDRRYTNSGDF